MLAVSELNKELCNIITTISNLFYLYKKNKQLRTKLKRNRTKVRLVVICKKQ